MGALFGHAFRLSRGLSYLMLKVITSTSRLSFFVHETRSGSTTAIENRNLVIIALVFNKCKNNQKKKVIQNTSFFTSLSILFGREVLVYREDGAD